MKKPQPSPFRTSQAVQRPDQIQERNRQRAYELYEARGPEDGHESNEWLIAESEVTRNFTARRSRTEGDSFLRPHPPVDLHAGCRVNENGLSKRKVTSALRRHVDL
jgi:hypothetical protein